MADHNNNTHIDTLELDPSDGVQYINELSEKLIEILSPCQTIEDIEDRLTRLYPQSKLVETFIERARETKLEKNHKSRHQSSSSFAGTFNNITSFAAKVINVVREGIGGVKGDDEVSKYKAEFIKSVTKDVLELASKFVRKQKSTSFIVTRNDIRTAMHADKDLMDMFLSDDKSLLIIGNYPVLANVLDPQKCTHHSSTIAYKEKIKKMLDSENTFRRNLKLIITVFKTQLKELHNNEKDVEIMFCNIENLEELSTELLDIFEDALESISHEEETPYIGYELQALAEACEFHSYFTFASGRLSQAWMDAYERVILHIQFIEDQVFYLAVKHLLPNYLLNSIIQFFEYYYSIKQLYEISRKHENHHETSHLNSTLSILLNTKISIEYLLMSDREKLSQINDSLEPRQADEIRKILEKRLDSELKELERKFKLPDLSQFGYKFSELDSPMNIIFENSENNQTPVIKSATLIKLVERLTYHKYRPNTVDYFLMTYRFFSDPKELLTLLIERYQVPNIKMGQKLDLLEVPSEFDEQTLVVDKQYLRRFRQEYSKPVKMRVINVIKSWVKNHYYDFEHDPALLEELNSFLDNVRKADIIFRSQIESIKNEQDKNSQKEQSKIELLVKEVQPDEFEHIDLLSLDPAEFAQQLCLFEFDIFKAITPFELINFCESGSKTRKDVKSERQYIPRLTRHFTLLSYWIRKRILETEDFEKRSELYNKSIRLMKELRNLNNFTGLLSIGSAIVSSPIIKLNNRELLTINNANKTVLQDYEKLNDKHQQKLQKELEKCNPPCIPFLGSYQTKLILAKEGNQTFNETCSPTTPISTTTTPLPTSRTTPTDQNRFFSQQFDCPKMINYAAQTMRAKLVAQIGIYQNQRYNYEVQERIIQQIKCVEYEITNFAANLRTGTLKNTKPDMIELTEWLDHYLHKQVDSITSRS